MLKNFLTKHDMKKIKNIETHETQHKLSIIL